MPWYGWLGWILMLTASTGFLLYFVLRKKQPANLAEAKLKLREMEDSLTKANEAIVAGAKVRKEAERKSAAMELKYLEEKHKAGIEALEEKERADYEKAKEDPESGIDYMRDLLGIGTGDSSSGPGPE